MAYNVGYRRHQEVSVHRACVYDEAILASSIWPCHPPLLEPSPPPTTFVILEMDDSHKSPAVEIYHPRHVVESGGSYTFRLLYFCI